MVAILGCSKKVQQPIYDWDYVNQYKDLTLVQDSSPSPNYGTEDNLPPKETFFICFNEFEKLLDYDFSFIPKVTAKTFEGKVVKKTTI